MIIFLDIDGVLNLKWIKKCDSNSINNLNLLKGDYVITSTWRINYSIEDLRIIFYYQGILGNIVGYTDIIDQGDRGEEIQNYITDNNITDNYIVVDDKISDIVDYIHHDKIYEIDSNKGITKNIINKIYEKYNINP